ncbi:hypothetical protein HWV62_39397 [Athelia sp. TMB]|nr:hypothetical protein HWV62_39397 [Athelia sp. TMB]
MPSTSGPGSTHPPAPLQAGPQPQAGPSRSQNRSHASRDVAPPAPTKPKAQPMGPHWLARQQEAANLTLSKKSAKLEKEELEEQKKRTCKFLIWYKNGQNPLTHTAFIKTYPDLPLKTLLPEFLQLGYRENSYIEYREDSTWMSARPDISITVNSAHTNLLRLAPSLIESLEDCPGLEEALKLQPRKLPKGKRAARDEVVSPVKVYRQHLQASAPQALRSTSPTLAPISVAHSRSPVAGPSRVRLAPAPFPLDVNTKQKRKVWPAQFYVCDVVDGLQEMKKLREKKVGQRCAFEKVFPGPVYNSGQFAATQRVLRHAGTTLVNRFVKRGRCSGAYWSVFRKKLPKDIDSTEFSNRKAIEDLADVSSSSSDDSTPMNLDDDDLSLDSDPESDSGSLTQSRLERCTFCNDVITVELSKDTLAMRDKLILQMPISFTKTFAYCELHRIESEGNKWPRTPDFGSLFDRTVALKGSLASLLTLEIVAKNEFYRDAQKSFAGMGTVAASRVGSQLGRFEGHGTGYYGDEGYIIIQSALMVMFPDYSFDTSPFPSLDWKLFREKVLIPEVSTRLIQEDLSLDRKASIKALRASQKFGSYFHSGDDSKHAHNALQQANKARRKTEGLQREGTQVDIDLTEREVKHEEHSSIDLPVPEDFREVLEGGKHIILIDD